MMKKDGKEIYTFTGLINRMDACRNRDYKFSEKDIPEEVEFRETIYKLSDDKKFYYDQRTGVTLAEVVGEIYGTDMYKYLTEHEFIVTPKEKVFLTSEEKEFLRMCNLLLGNDNTKLSRVMRLQYSDPVSLGLVFCSDPNTVASEVWLPIAPTTFSGLEDARVYTLRDLKVYE
jgi:hypothetical protein